MTKKALNFLLLFAVSIQAQTVRKYSNEFLNIGVDAAALGMSSTTTAHTSDVNAGYWNPAGLVHVKNKQIGLMHASYFANIAQYDYIGYASPIDSISTLGLSVIRFGVDDILNTTQLIDNNGQVNYNNISLFSTSDYAFTLSYARNTRYKGLSYGINAKVVRRIIGDFANSWGFGFDAGLQYQKKNWSFGLMARDITTTSNIWLIDEEAFVPIQNAVAGQNQELPEKTEITLPKVQFGISRSFSIKDKYGILISGNLNSRFTRTNDILSSEKLSIDPALGMQLDLKKIVFLRAGVGNFQRIRQFDYSFNTSFKPNIGLGFQYKGITFDYALTNIGDLEDAMYSNVFSLKIDWSLFSKKS